ncbi:MAG: phosphoribosylglycinamide formyltransferase [Bacillota bacterium]|nr:phosphoribosylglycinamide formyltransferase [Bacillota bacterium]
MTRITVMVSGGGTNLQAVIDAAEAGTLGDASVVLVISSNAGAYALERAARHGIPSVVIGREEYPDPEERTGAILDALKGAETDLVVLAGYMSVLPPALIRAYRDRIINIHPALLPKFGGMGMYGIRVHRAVLAAGEAESGATVHFVDEGVDTGRIILQERVPVLEGDSPETLAARVLEAEHRILPEAIRRLTKAD